MSAILPFAFPLFLIVVGIFTYAIVKKISTKLSIRLMGLYLVILLLSPFLAALTEDAGHEGDGSTHIPPNHYSNVLENYRDYSLEDLKKDRYLATLHEEELSVDPENFSKENPFVILTMAHHADEWSNRDPENYLIVEKTDAVNSVVITQFQQRSFIRGVDITEQLEPWHWSLESWSTGNRQLNVEVQRSEVQLYSLSPLLQAFQFDASITNRTFAREFPSINSGTILWVQVPEALSIKLQGREPFRILE